MCHTVSADPDSYHGKPVFNGRRPSCAFAVSTYGTTPGVAGLFMRKALKGKLGCELQLLSVKMPDTWTPIFDLSDRAHVAAINEVADREIDAVCRSIVDRETSRRMRGQVPGRFIPVANAYYGNMRKTSSFTVEDTCVGCGLCAKRCPVGPSRWSTESLRGPLPNARSACAACTIVLSSPSSMDQKPRLTVSTITARAIYCLGGKKKRLKSQA